MFLSNFLLKCITQYLAQLNWSVGTVHANDTLAPLTLSQSWRAASDF